MPEHARVLAAFGGLAGLRLGAIAGLRWGDLDTTATPLWRLTSSRAYDGKPTKIGKASVVPVHPVLAEMLATWRHGWGQMFGRAPAADDPIVPRAPGKWRDAPGTAHREDRRRPDGRHPDDAGDPGGADEGPRAPLDLHTHGARRRRRRPPDRAHHAHARQEPARLRPLRPRGLLAQLCAEVAKIAIIPKAGGRVVPLALGLATSLATVRRTRKGSAMLYVEAAGIEPASENASG